MPGARATGQGSERERPDRHKHRWEEAAEKPPGTGVRPQPQLEQAKRLNDEAAATLAEGTAARETADQYVPALPRL